MDFKQKHGSHRMCLTASQLPAAKATGSSSCMVCIEPTDSERVQPSNRKCKLIGITNSSKQKQRAVKTLTLLDSQDTFLLITLMSFEISDQDLGCLLLTLSTTNLVNFNPIQYLKVPKTLLDVFRLRKVPTQRRDLHPLFVLRTIYCILRGIM